MFPLWEVSWVEYINPHIFNHMLSCAARCRPVEHAQCLLSSQECANQCIDEVHIKFKQFVYSHVWCFHRKTTRTVSSPGLAYVYLHHVLIRSLYLQSEQWGGVLLTPRTRVRECCTCLSPLTQVGQQRERERERAPEAGMRGTGPTHSSRGCTKS